MKKKYSNRIWVKIGRSGYYAYETNDENLAKRMDAITAQVSSYPDIGVPLKIYIVEIKKLSIQGQYAVNKEPDGRYPVVLHDSGFDSLSDKEISCLIVYEFFRMQAAKKAYRSWIVVFFVVAFLFLFIMENYNTRFEALFGFDMPFLFIFLFLFLVTAFRVFYLLNTEIKADEKVIGLVNDPYLYIAVLEKQKKVYSEKSMFNFFASYFFKKRIGKIKKKYGGLDSLIT